MYRLAPPPRFRCGWLALCIATGASPCLAGVTTIHDAGPTVPIGPFMAGLSPEAAPQAAAPPPPASITLPVAFPVTTPLMRPGQLRSAMRLRTAGGLASPFFLLGDDTLSRQWLATYRDRLHRAGATGLVVNVTSLAAFRSLHALAPQVPMAAASAEDIARQAGLSVYPLFVSADAQLTQQVP